MLHFQVGGNKEDAAEPEELPVSEVGDCVSENSPLQLTLSLTNAHTCVYSVLSVASMMSTPVTWVVLILEYS